MNIRDSQQRGVVEALAARTDALTRTFVTHGSADRTRPIVIRLSDGQVVSFPMREVDRSELAPLLDVLTPAAVGKGEQTVVDPAVRRALSAKAAGVFTIEGVELDGVLAQIAADLTADTGEPPTAELLDVHVYGPGGHFEPHKDTPRGADMLGTLVVCLPSRFRGGVLRVGEGDEQEELDWDAALRARGGTSRLHWAAFFSDVDHAISPITGGFRVTLTYVLRRRAAAVAPARPADGAAALTAELVRAAKDLTGPLTLVFPCRHLYADSALARGSEALRGRDREIVRAAMAAGLTARVRPYLALGTDAEGDPFYALEHTTGLQTLATLPAEVGPDDLEALGPDDAGVRLTVPVARWYRKHLGTRNYSETGYFGNEGAHLDFYRCAAVEVEIAARDEARGRRVRHAKFGTGQVVRSETRDGEVRLEVAFDDGTTRTLLGRFVIDA